MQQGETDFLAILQSLAEHRVEFIVVGGISAVLQGAPIATFDLDVVHSLSSENIQRLLKALDELGASYRAAGRPSLKPDASHLASSGHQLLITRVGPLDLLGSIGKDVPSKRSSVAEEHHPPACYCPSWSKKAYH